MHATLQVNCPASLNQCPIPTRIGSRHTLAEVLRCPLLLRPLEQPLPPCLLLQSSRQPIPTLKLLRCPSTSGFASIPGSAAGGPPLACPVALRQPAPCINSPAWWTWSLSAATIPGESATASLGSAPRASYRRPAAACTKSPAWSPSCANSLGAATTTPPMAVKATPPPCAVATRLMAWSARPSVSATLRGGAEVTPSMACPAAWRLAAASTVSPAPSTWS